MALDDVKLIIICLLEPRAESYVANDTDWQLYNVATVFSSSYPWKWAVG